MNTINYLTNHCRGLIPLQQKDGSFPAGHNGPHKDQETPVRNTSHFLIYNCYLFKTTGDKIFREAAQKASDYLMKKDTRPMGNAYWCRLNPEKDFNNGLIGQAWALEALVYASGTLEREDLYNAAIDLVKKHKWDPKYHLWHNLNVDGSYGGINNTYNQQLWFTSIVLKLYGEEELYRQACITGKELINRVKTYKNGIIYLRTPVVYYKSNLKNQFLYFRNRWKNSKPARHWYNDIYYRSVGYHAFTLIPIAEIASKLNLKLPSKICKAVEITTSDFYYNEVSSNRFALAYNQSYTEAAITQFLLNYPNNGRIKELLDKQVEHLDFLLKKDDFSTIDKNTFIIKPYQVYRFGEYFAKI